MPKKNSSPQCCKCQAWDIADAAKIQMQRVSAKCRNVIVGTCLRRSPRVVATFNEDGVPIMSSAWPITDEDKGCYDIIWKEEDK